MDIINKIDKFVEEERVDEAAVTAVFMDFATTLNDIQSKAGSGKARKDALKKLEIKVRKSSLTSKMKDAFINGILSGFKKGAGL